jgi:hypothetical protein
LTSVAVIDAELAHELGEPILGLLGGAPPGLFQDSLAQRREDGARLLVPSRDGARRHAQVLGECLV